VNESVPNCSPIGEPLHIELAAGCDANPDRRVRIRLDDGQGEVETARLKRERLVDDDTHAHGLGFVPELDDVAGTRRGHGGGKRPEGVRAEGQPGDGHETARFERDRVAGAEPGRADVGVQPERLA